MTDYLIMTEYYICDSPGGDVSIPNGSKEHPFPSIEELFLSLQIKKDQPINFKVFLYESDEFKEMSKAKIKKSKTTYLNKKKQSTEEKGKGGQKEKENELTLQELTMDKSLPEPLKLHDFDSLKNLENKRVQINGWVQFIRKQSKKLWFITVRYRSKHIQVVFENALCKSTFSPDVSEECSIRIWGTISATNSTPAQELKADYFEVIGKSVAGGIDSVLNVESDVETKYDNRHLMIRGAHTSKIIQLQGVVFQAFRQFYAEENMVEAIPPTLVQNQCEGGSTLFKFDYFGEEAYLSQSSQLYYETLVPVVGDCFGITRSYRAEKSRTRRHLSEYNHVEAELGFLTFDDLLNHIERLIVRVSEIILQNAPDLLLSVNPDYKPLKGPFKRMTYEEAIQFLEKHEIRNPEGNYYKFGEDIPEGAERKILDILQEVVMITKFPAGIKAFYMPRCADDDRVTESVDVLMPGVGEIVGGSMRIWKYDELMDAYQRNELDPKPYYWYTDLRRYGSMPHGGYGLGFERFLTWVLNKEHIRDVCLYPRYTGRCKP